MNGNTPLRSKLDRSSNFDQMRMLHADHQASYGLQGTGPQAHGSAFWGAAHFGIESYCVRKEQMDTERERNKKMSGKTMEEGNWWKRRSYRPQSLIWQLILTWIPWFTLFQYWKHEEKLPNPTLRKYIVGNTSNYTGFNFFCTFSFYLMHPFHFVFLRRFLKQIPTRTRPRGARWRDQDEMAREVGARAKGRGAIVDNIGAKYLPTQGTRCGKI